MRPREAAYGQALQKSQAGVLGTRLPVSRLLAGERAAGIGRARTEERMGRSLPLARGTPRRRVGDARRGEAGGGAGGPGRSEPTQAVRQELSGGYLGVLERQPLHALLPEVDLQPGVRPRAFRADDHALPELRVQHRLADAEPVAGRLRLELLFGRGRPRLVVEAPATRERGEALYYLRRNLVDEARGDVVARLAVQHARLRVAEVQALPRPRDRYVHEPALLFQPVVLERALLVRKEALFQAGDEHRRELQALRRVHSHQLQRVGSFGGLVLARFQRRMREERG